MCNKRYIRLSNMCVDRLLFGRKYVHISNMKAMASRLHFEAHDVDVLF